MFHPLRHILAGAVKPLRRGRRAVRSGRPDQRFVPGVFSLDERLLPGYASSGLGVLRAVDDPSARRAPVRKGRRGNMSSPW